MLWLGVGDALVLLCRCFGDVSVIVTRYIGYALVRFWRYYADILLTMCWPSGGDDVLVMSWQCFNDVLAMLCR